MISKELLSEVLEKNVDKVKGIENNTLIYGVLPSDGWHDEINIHELAHKCKEWANAKEFHLWSKLGECQLETFEASHNLDIEHFKSDTEPEAIFKACEWILNNK